MVTYKTQNDRNDQSALIPDEFPEEYGEGFLGMNGVSEQRWQLPESLADLFGRRYNNSTFSSTHS